MAAQTSCRYAGAALPLVLALALAAPAHAAPVGWAPTGSLSVPRVGQRAVTLDDGRVLVVGGRGGAGILRSAERFDPHTGRWSPAAPMQDSRDQFDLIKLRDGSVLAGGGYGLPSGAGAQTFLASVERYDPRTNTWTRAGSFTKPRSLVTMVPFATGGAMAFGGWYTAGGWSSGVELFLPGSSTWYLSLGSTDGATGGHVQLSDGRVLFANAGRLYDPGSNI